MAAAREHDFPLVLLHGVVPFIEVTESVYPMLIAGEVEELRDLDRACDPAARGPRLRGGARRAADPGRGDLRRPGRPVRRERRPRSAATTCAAQDGLTVEFDVGRNPWSVLAVAATDHATVAGARRRAELCATMIDIRLGATFRSGRRPERQRRPGAGAGVGPVPLQLRHRGAGARCRPRRTPRVAGRGPRGGPAPAQLVAPRAARHGRGGPVGVRRVAGRRDGPRVRGRHHGPPGRAALPPDDLRRRAGPRARRHRRPQRGPRLGRTHGRRRRRPGAVAARRPRGRSTWPAGSASGRARCWRATWASTTCCPTSPTTWSWSGSCRSSWARCWSTTPGTARTWCRPWTPTWRRGSRRPRRAQALGIRRQTLYARLERISRLLGGLDIEARQARTALDLALVSWRMRASAVTGR